MSFNRYHEENLRVTCLSGIIQGQATVLTHSVSRIISGVKMSCDSCMLKQVFMYNTHVKSKEKIPTYCHGFSDRRRGIGLTIGFIGSTLTTRGYNLQFPVTHTH
jgi:hypothetical protein